MKLVVGLGNPGRKYQKTRHNVGYDVIGLLAQRFATGKPKNRFQGALIEADVEGERSLLLCPETYMNRSGDSVQPARDYYRLQNSDLMIVCDDFQLPLGRIRFRSAGSAGGQKGLDDILHRLATQDVPRLRIGIGPVAEGWDPSDFVLSRFNKQEASRIAEVMTRAADGVVSWVHHGIDYCMNHYNRECNDDDTQNRS